MNRAWIACALLAIATAGCSRQEATSDKNRAAASGADLAPAAKVTKEDKAKPVYVDGVTLTVVDGATGKEMRYEATLYNNSATPVDGVELSISLVNAENASVGGHVTQYFFQPAVPSHGQQALLVQLPAIKAKDDISSLSAKITVVQQLKAQPGTAATSAPAIAPAIAAAGVDPGPGAPTTPASEEAKNLSLAGTVEPSTTGSTDPKQ